MSIIYNEVITLDFFAAYYYYQNQKDRRWAYDDKWEYLIKVIGIKIIAYLINDPPAEKCDMQERTGSSFNDGEQDLPIISWPINNWCFWKNKYNITWDLYLLSDGSLTVIDAEKVRLMQYGHKPYAVRLRFVERPIYRGYEGPNYHMVVYDALSAMAIELGVTTTKEYKQYRSELVNLNKKNGKVLYK